MELKTLVNTIKNIVDEDVQVDTQTVQKGSLTLTGISIGKGDIRPVAYVDYYEDLFLEKGYLAVARKIIEVCKEAEKETIKIDTKLFTTWEYAKDNLLLCIAPAGTNNNIITIPFLDLELYFRVTISEDTSQTALYKVQEQMLDIWNVTTEDLLEACNTNEYTALPMKDIMIGILKDEGYPNELIEEITESDVGNQIVLTNPSKTFGASVIYKKTLLKEVADKYESDLYIIPSSIHELIACPVNTISVSDMNDMISQINENEVSPEERLSDHVYIFHRDTMEIEW